MKLNVKFEENKKRFSTDFGEVHNVTDGGYERGYAEGKAEGYANGHNIGVTEGYANGHTNGVAEGYSNGYDVGYQTGYDLVAKQVEEIENGSY